MITPEAHHYRLVSDETELLPILDFDFGDNSIFVVTEDAGIRVYPVTDGQGKLLYAFDWPRNRPVRVIKNGYLYTRETEEESGLAQIVRYRIDSE